MIISWVCYSGTMIISWVCYSGTMIISWVCYSEYNRVGWTMQHWSSACARAEPCNCHESDGSLIMHSIIDYSPTMKGGGTRGQGCNQSLITRSPCAPGGPPLPGHMQRVTWHDQCTVDEPQWHGATRKPLHYAMQCMSHCTMPCNVFPNTMPCNVCPNTTQAISCHETCGTSTLPSLAKQAT